jgi:hypothetical protein
LENNKKNLYFCPIGLSVYQTRSSLLLKLTHLNDKNEENRRKKAFSNWLLAVALGARKSEIKK